MKAISGKALCKVVEKHGWELKRITGSQLLLQATIYLEGALGRTPNASLSSKELNSSSMQDKKRMSATQYFLLQEHLEGCLDRQMLSGQKNAHVHLLRSRNI